MRRIAPCIASCIASCVSYRGGHSKHTVAAAVVGRGERAELLLPRRVPDGEHNPPAADEQCLRAKVGAELPLRADALAEAVVGEAAQQRRLAHAHVTDD
eukprot:scaffold66515_cov66-Phaeocystis_antarctica.AAC.5